MTTSSFVGPIIAMLILVGSVAHAAPLAYPTNSLIGLYRFDGDTKDRSGFNLGTDLSQERITFNEDRFGNTNSAAFFNGANSIARTSTNNLLREGQVSILLWVKLNSTKTATIFNRFNYGTNSFWDDLSFFANYPSGKESFMVCNWSGNDGNPPDSIATVQSSFPVNQWFHIALVVSTNAMSVYRDGVLFVELKNVNKTRGKIFQKQACWAFGAQAQTSGPESVLYGLI
ncbi:MAG: LamG-like jellyroll fold domain-containing protein, partial [Bacteroidota bacterium]